MIFCYSSLSLSPFLPPLSPSLETIDDKLAASQTVGVVVPGWRVYVHADGPAGRFLCAAALLLPDANH